MNATEGASIARTIKETACTLRPMADLDAAVFVIDAAAGLHVVMVPAWDVPDELGQLAAMARAIVAELGPDLGAVRTVTTVGDCYYRTGSTAPGYRRGQLAAEWAEDPRTSVRMGLAVCTVDAEGACGVLLPYVWGDDGRPVWGEPDMAGGQAGGRMVDLARALVEVAPR